MAVELRRCVSLFSRFHPFCPKLPPFHQIHLQDLSCFCWILGHPSQHKTRPVHYMFSTNLLMLIPACISTHLITWTQKQAFHTLNSSVCEDSALTKKTFSCKLAGCLSFSQPRDIPHQSLKMHWDVPNRSPGPVPLIRLLQLKVKNPSSQGFTIHTTSQTAGFSGQTGIFFKTTLQLPLPFVIGLWWLSRKIRT